MYSNVFALRWTSNIPHFIKKKKIIISMILYQAAYMWTSQNYAQSYWSKTQI